MSKSASSGWRVFRHRDFRWFIVGRFFSGLAQQMLTVGVGLYVYEATRDPLALGLTGLFTFLPQLLFVAHAGHVADSNDRRIVSSLCYGLNAVSALGLFVIAALSVTATAPVYAMIALVGVARVFGMPANAAMLANLVPHEDRAPAIAVNSSMGQIPTIVGPAIGGLLYIAGPKIVFAVALAINLVAALGMLMVSAQKPDDAPENFTWSAFFEGAQFIRSRPALLGAISLDLVAVLFGGIVSLLPIFAIDILHAGPEGLGLLRTATAVGALGMALYLAQHPITRHTGVWMLVSVAIFGATIIGFGLSRDLWLSMLLLGIGGAADMVSVVIRSAIIQNDTPDSMRGRVSSFSTLFIGASNSLGDFESGLVAGMIGTVPATLVGGVFSIAATLVWAKIFPDLRRRDALMGAPEKRPI